VAPRLATVMTWPAGHSTRRRGQGRFFYARWSHNRRRRRVLTGEGGKWLSGGGSDKVAADTPIEGSLTGGKALTSEGGSGGRVELSSVISDWEKGEKEEAVRKHSFYSQGGRREGGRMCLAIVVAARC
jgi:hypothetical protein